jgi:hypothetical protein
MLKNMEIKSRRQVQRAGMRIVRCKCPSANSQVANGHPVPSHYCSTLGITFGLELA